MKTENVTQSLRELPRAYESSQKRADAMRITSIPNVLDAVQEIKLSENGKEQLERGFAGETDAFREHIEAKAKLTKQDKFTLYARILFQHRLNVQYDAAVATIVREVEKFVVPMVAKGFKKEALALCTSAGLDMDWAKEKFGITLE